MIPQQWAASSTPLALLNPGWTGSSPASRQPQPSLGDDLPLDLARPTVDGRDHRVSNPMLQQPVEHGPVLVAGDEAVGPGQVDEIVRRRYERLGEEQLGHR